MTIYIASSWKNQHAVEMLTAMLRKHGHEVRSFIENNHGEYQTKKEEEWINSDEADKAFRYDTENAYESDLVIYLGPSGKDAAAELGLAYSTGKPIIGLWAKGEDLGLMRKMVTVWAPNYEVLIQAVNSHEMHTSG